MSWQSRAACRGQSSLWFSDMKADRRLAQKVCAGCPVKEPCAEAGRGERFGVWGGEDHGEAERHRRYRWELRHKRTCEWCSTVFFWQAKPDVPAPAFCSEDCEKALRLARAAELYRQRLEATG